MILRVDLALCRVDLGGPIIIKSVRVISASLWATMLGGKYFKSINLSLSLRETPNFFKKN